MAVGVCVVGGFRRRGDSFGEAVGDWDMEDEERERVMRVTRVTVVEAVVVTVLSTFGLLGLAVVLRVLLPWRGTLSRSLVEASRFGSRASKSLLDGLAGLSVDPAAMLFLRRKRFNLPWKLVILSTERSSVTGGSGEPSCFFGGSSWGTSNEDILAQSVYVCARFGFVS